MNLIDENFEEKKLKEDKNKKNRGIINHNVTNIYQMFDFSAEEIEELFCNKCEEWAKKLELNEGAKHFIDDAPIIGNNVEVGFGAVIIGKVKIADGIKIGANSVVTNSFLEPNITIAGVPAKKIK